MPDPLAPADPGLLASILDTARLGGFAIRNLFKGNLEGVGRNVADLAGRGLDAITPGDWIDDISRPEDRPEFKDLVDLGGDNVGTDILNFLGDVATDPVSYIPGAAFAKAGTLAKSGAGKVVSKLPTSIQTPLRDGAATLGRNIRSVAGAQRVAPGTAAAVAAKQATSDLVGRAGAEGTVDALAGLSDKELLALGQAGHGLRLDPATGLPASVLDETGTMGFDQRLAKLLTEDPALNPAKLLAAAPKAQTLLKDMWAAGQEHASSPGGGVFFRNEAPAAPDILMGGYKEAASQGVKDYFPKQFSGLKADEIDELTGLPKNLPGQTPAVGGIPSPVKERADWGPAEILTYLAQNPKVKLEFNAAKALSQRASTQGELAGRAQVGQSLFDRAAAGEVPLPDDLVRTLNAKLPKPRAVVSGTATETADVGQMLGGQISRHQVSDPYGIGSYSGKSKPPELTGAEDVSALLGGPRAEAQNRLTASGPGTDPYYEADMWNLKLAREDSGAFAPGSKSAVGKSSTPEEFNPSLRAMGIGPQSGKAVVGKSTADTAPLVVTDAERKSASDYLKSRGFRYADPELRSAAQAIAKQFPAEEATVLLNALDGLAPRGGFTDALAKLNRPFKGAAVFGAIIPKLGAITRNLVGGIFQQAAHAEARGDIPRAMQKLVPNWLHSVDDGIEKLFGARIGKNEFAEVESAFKASGGDPRKVLPLIKDKDMREAVKNGVLGNNFINSEEIIRSAAKGGWKSFGKNLISYPASMFLGAEQRMRYGLWKALRAKDKSEAEAARIVTESFFDYGTHSAANRAVRDYFPFAQFLLKAAPSQAKFLAEKPWAMSAAANAQGSSRDPIYPFMQGGINLPVGRDENGNRQYLSSLGLPVEAISSIPNLSANPLDFGRQFEQKVVGASQPLLKAAYSLTSGREPYLGSQYGSYGRLPVIGEAGAPGRLINQLLGTGLPGAAQAQGVLGTIGKASDERTNLGEKAAAILTGAKITSVDESRALQQLLENALKRDPSVGQYLTLNNRDDSDQTQALLDSLKAAKADIKAKRKAILPVN